jgi:glucokinase
MLLAGDIGGTKVHLSLLRIEKDTAQRVRSRRFESRRYPSLEAVLSEFLGPHPPRISRACFGVAGPVVEGRCQTPNLPWSLDEGLLRGVLRTSRVRLLNDLEAMAYGVLALGPRDLAVLHPGKNRRGNAAVLAAGTGLGQSCLLWDGARYHPQASEGGHADFAPRNALERGLHEHLERAYGHVSYERVLSGPGLHAIYLYLRDTGHGPEPRWLAERMARADPSAVVSEVALAGRSALCRRALELFVSVYGAEAGNLALRHLALGGIYLGGGIAPKILPALRWGPFLKAFLAKGRLRPLLEEIPVRVILSPKTALWGAERFAATL